MQPVDLQSSNKAQSTTCWKTGSKHSITLGVTLPLWTPPAETKIQVAGGSTFPSWKTSLLPAASHWQWHWFSGLHFFFLSPRGQFLCSYLPTLAHSRRKPPTRGPQIIAPAQILFAAGVVALSLATWRPTVGPRTDDDHLATAGNRLTGWFEGFQLLAALVLVYLFSLICNV